MNMSTRRTPNPFGLCCIATLVLSLAVVGCSAPVAGASGREYKTVFVRPTQDEAPSGYWPSLAERVNAVLSEQSAGGWSLVTADFVSNEGTVVMLVFSRQP